MFHVLIAEDDEELRDLFRRVLIKNGYNVTGVSNGKEALDALENDYYDIIISDIMMPIMDGYHLVRHLRDAGNNIPARIAIIAMTTNNSISVNLFCFLSFFFISISKLEYFHYLHIVFQNHSPNL